MDANAFREIALLILKIVGLATIGCAALCAVLMLAAFVKTTFCALFLQKKIDISKKENPDDPGKAS